MNVTPLTAMHLAILSMLVAHDKLTVPTMIEILGISSERNANMFRGTIARMKLKGWLKTERIFSETPPAIGDARYLYMVGEAGRKVYKENIRLVGAIASSVKNQDW